MHPPNPITRCGPIDLGASAFPQIGLLSILPQRLVPCVELMRLDRPAGFYAFYVPYLIGLGSGFALGRMIAGVNLKEPISCAWFFYCEFWYVGGSMVMGLFGEYFARRHGLRVTDVGFLLSCLF